MKWGKADISKLRPKLGEDLEWIELPLNVPKKLRLVSDPIIWQVHWLSIYSTDGERKVLLPLNCIRWNKELLAFDPDLKKCFMCIEDLPKYCEYSKEWDKGPSFRGYALAIDRSAQEEGANFIKIFTFPVTVYERIEEFAREWSDPSGIDGYDITVIKTRKDFFRYSVVPDRNSSKLTEAEIEALNRIMPSFLEFYRDRTEEEIRKRLQEVHLTISSSEEKLDDVVKESRKSDDEIEREIEKLFQGE